jgi:hypothetical protein
MQRKILILVLLFHTLIANSQRGQVNESEWRDPEDGGKTSWTSYLITLLVLFGIPWVISEIIKSRDSRKK